MAPSSELYTGNSPAQVFTQLKPMPIPRTSGAPTFDGKYVNDFLAIIERHGRAAGLDFSELPKYIVQYCTDEVKQVIRFCEELAGDDWPKAKVLLVELYGSNDEPVKATLESLRAYVRENAKGKEFAARGDVDVYHRGYLTIAAQLKSKKMIDDVEMRLKFFAGLPKRTRAFVTTRLPAENLITTSPPAIKDVIDIICRQFNPTSIESYNVESDGEDSDGDVVMAPATKTSTVQLSSILDPPKHKPANVKTEIDTLAQQLQQLSLNQAQMQQLFQTAMSSGSFNRPANNLNVGEKTCFICGQAGTHRLHPRYCPETAKLITEALIKFDPALNRYTLMDGADLPQIPFTPGGVAQYMRDHRSDFPRRDAPPHITVNASPATLMMGGRPAICGDVYAIAANQDEYFYYDAAPVTRTGKDTSARMDPARRPARNGPDRPPTPGAPTAAPPVRPQPPSSATQQPNITMPQQAPPPINTREGWKDSLPRNQKDVQMKDDSKAKQYHYTSDVQDKVSIEGIQDVILDTRVTLTLRDILGISPGLQKRMAEATKTRREYVTKYGEYDLYTEQAERELERHSEARMVQSASTIQINELGDPAMLDSFMLRYSNAVSFKPTKKYAMTTGIFSAELAGLPVRFMVDCGSELNIFPERLLAQTSIPLDYEGTRWSLKGVNGGPVGLRGVCKDVSVSIGGHRFDHHFFVTRDDMEAQDCILGQPWIQWYAARIDYSRFGHMKILLWKDGDRAQNPTVSVQLTRPNDPRNVDATGPLPGAAPHHHQDEAENAYQHHHHHSHPVHYRDQRATIEDVPEGEEQDLKHFY